MKATTKHQVPHLVLSAATIQQLIDQGFTVPALLPAGQDFPLKKIIEKAIASRTLLAMSYLDVQLFLTLLLAIRRAEYSGRTPAQAVIVGILSQSLTTGLDPEKSIYALVCANYRGTTK